MQQYYYSLFTIKRYVEQFIMFPFILVGKLLAILKPLDLDYDNILFFTSYGIGGAERVNAEILEILKDKKTLVIFTKKTGNEGMLHFFQQEKATIHDISPWTDNKWTYFMNFIYRGRYATYINKQILTQVFIGHCNFGYKILPHINRSIFVSELLHMHVPSFLWVWAPFIQFVNKRVLIGYFFIDQLKEIYKENGIPVEYTQRFVVIRNCLEYIPESQLEKPFSNPLKVYYAGRGGAQKRVWILAKVIKACREKGLDLQFKLAGPFGEELPQELTTDGTYVGQLQGGEEMYNFHKDNDILLMTSAWEGFPIVIMEAVAFGSAVIAPAVDAIPENVTHEKTGFIISEVEDEEKMVEEIVSLLDDIINQKYNLSEIVRSSFDTLHANFSKKLFVDNYKSLFEQGDVQ